MMIPADPLKGRPVSPGVPEAKWDSIAQALVVLAVVLATSWLLDDMLLVLLIPARAAGERRVDRHVVGDTGQGHPARCFASEPNERLSSVPCGSIA